MKATFIEQYAMGWANGISSPCIYMCHAMSFACHNIQDVGSCWGCVYSTVVDVPGYVCTLPDMPHSRTMGQTVGLLGVSITPIVGLMHKTKLERKQRKQR